MSSSNKKQISQIKLYKFAGAMAFASILMTQTCWAEGLSLPGLSVQLQEGGSGNYSNAMKVLALLTVLSLAPAILIAMTAFTRIIIVLAMLRHAFGMPSTPPNSVLVSLALFLTFFTMQPMLDSLQATVYQPYQANQMTDEQALNMFGESIKTFMVAQTRERDIALMYSLQNKEPPTTLAEVSLITLAPAFMLSELQTAFQIGFVIFLPFLAVDLIVASVLMSMGMIMLPPMTISLPIKILMFVLIEGWALVAEALVGSFL
jgi:flagellar biosynthetic protein FliP